MKIVIAGTAWPMRGGIAQYNSLLYKYFSVKHDVKVYSFKVQYPEFLFPGKTQFEEGNTSSPFPPGKNIVSINSVNPFNWIINGFKFSGEKADLIIFKYWLPFFAPAYFTISFIAKLFSKAKVLVICDNIIPHEKRFGDRFFTKLFFSQVSYFIVQSKTVEEDLKQFNKSKPYKLIPHPVYNIFGEKVSKEEGVKFLNENFVGREKDAGPPIKAFGGTNLFQGTINSEDKIILFFGYIRKYKGLGYLIDAMKTLKEENIKLIVAGEFYEDEEKYRKQIIDNDLSRNIFVISDFLPDDKIKYLFSASDVVVLPYVSATQSGIIQAAYNFDKPVIATDVGGLAEVVINNKTGYIIESENVKEISDSVLKFYKENKVEEFTENVKQEKKKYTWEEFVKNAETLVDHSH